MKLSHRYGKLFKSECEMMEYEFRLREQVYLLGNINNAWFGMYNIPLRRQTQLFTDILGTNMMNVPMPLAPKNRKSK